jgi:hypothetical protein
MARLQDMCGEEIPLGELPYCKWQGGEIVFRSGHGWRYVSRLKPVMKNKYEVRLFKAGVRDNDYSCSKLVIKSTIANGCYRVYKPREEKLEDYCPEYCVGDVAQARKWAEDKVNERKCSMNTVTACIVKQTKRDDGSCKTEFVTQPEILIAGGEADAKLMMALKYPTKVKVEGNLIATAGSVGWNLQGVRL